MIERLGKWIVIYLVAKWAVLGSLIYWLSQFDWFRFEYLLILPIAVAMGLGLKLLFRKFRLVS